MAKQPLLRPLELVTSGVPASTNRQRGSSGLDQAGRTINNRTRYADAQRNQADDVSKNQQNLDMSLLTCNDA